MSTILQDRNLDVRLRPLSARNDLSAVLAIEAHSFRQPRTAGMFKAYLALPNVFGRAAEVDKLLVGFSTYEICPTKIVLTVVAVDQFCRRCGVGKALVKKVKSEAAAKGLYLVKAMVSETNLPAQLMLKGQDFLATRIAHGAFDDLDGYEFTFSRQARL